jgi:hypothetical protein
MAFSLISELPVGIKLAPFALLESHGSMKRRTSQH